MSIQMKEVDFCVLKEDYSRFILEDGTLLKVKILLNKIFLSPMITPEGYPSNIAFAADNILSAIVPDSLKRNPSSPEQYIPEVDKGEEIKFHEQLINEQEYFTDNGYRITVRPVVTKVFRYKKYNQFNEPVYSATIQQITNIDKIKSTDTK